jgi:hypothetical protein
MLTVPKLLGPRRGMLWPRFALDEQGLLPTDPVVAFSTPGSAQGRVLLGRMRDTLAQRLDRAVSARDLLIYVMAFMNAVPAAAVLRIGRLPTAKGGWSVDEEYLTSVRIAVPDDNRLVQEIWSRSDHVVTRTSQGDVAGEDLDDLIGRALGLDAGVRRELEAWARAERPKNDGPAPRTARAGT